MCGSFHSLTARFEGGFVRVCFGSCSGLLRVTFGAFRTKVEQYPNKYRTMFAKTPFNSEQDMVQNWYRPEAGPDKSFNDRRIKMIQICVYFKKASMKIKTLLKIQGMDLLFGILLICIEIRYVKRI